MGGLRTGDWLDRGRVARVAIVSALAGLAMLAFLTLSGNGAVDAMGRPVGTDFSVFWNAGRIANEGQAATAWDPDVLNAAARDAHGEAVAASAWLYPPVFLFVAAPLGGLPYLPALLLWQAFSLAAIAAALWVILSDRRAVLVALASPLSPMVLGHGQNAFLTAALLGVGLALLDRHPLRAGGLLGALLYKPQLGLLLGPMLLLARNWRAIAGAAAVAGALVGLSVLLWGVESWQAFIGSLALGRLYMEEGAVGFFKSASLFSMARQWGAGVPAGYAVQAIGLVAAFIILWRVRSAHPTLRAAGTCAAIALSTPYLLDYDMAIVGVGAAFIYARGARDGFLSYEKSTLAFIWVAPWFARGAAQAIALPLGPMAMALLAWLVVRRASLTASPSRRSHEASAL